MNDENNERLVIVIERLVQEVSNIKRVIATVGLSIIALMSFICNITSLHDDIVGIICLWLFSLILIINIHPYSAK